MEVTNVYCIKKEVNAPFRRKHPQQLSKTIQLSNT